MTKSEIKQGSFNSVRQLIRNTNWSNPAEFIIAYRAVECHREMTTDFHASMQRVRDFQYKLIPYMQIGMCLLYIMAYITAYLFFSILANR